MLSSPFCQTLTRLHNIRTARVSSPKPTEARPSLTHLAHIQYWLTNTAMRPREIAGTCRTKTHINNGDDASHEAHTVIKLEIKKGPAFNLSFCSLSEEEKHTTAVKQNITAAHFAKHTVY